MKKKKRRIQRVSKLLKAGHELICYWCGISVERARRGDKLVLQDNHATVDHVISISKGGLDKPFNCVICCNKCNQIRAKKSNNEFVNDDEIKLLDAIKQKEYDFLPKYFQGFKEYQKWLNSPERKDTYG